ncbi:conjugal transfer protein TrbC [Novosphingobium sp. ERN07]|uniref:TrbC/VirB2 family protein n=1 Tax=Novosphingobium sp. ERN07 TaxID=2726187 RepID=UPI001456B357|nr:TrbC/VirB2 family protein [Novosphingobium sp. ERN07]NLR73393.1 conjugal transfer protein TrbC [Novosphingobium sp. ERN07]
MQVASLWTRRLTCALIGSSAFASKASAAASSSDPAGSGPIVHALFWLQGTLMGNVATTMAVIAVAMVGFMMLTGRMNWRFGATVIIGCFILFGSASIVSGIRSTTSAVN